MAFNDSRPQAERQRLRKLAQAALNADATVDQVNEILGGLGPTLIELAKTIGKLDAAIDELTPPLARFAETIDGVDRAVAGLAEITVRMERVVTRVEAIVGIAEAALRPISMIESAGRSITTRLGLS